MSVEVNGILVAAHELKAPLCLIRQLTLALQNTSDEVKAERLEHQLLQTSERALNQITDLTKIARLKDGLFVSEPVSVRGVCDAVLRELSPLFHAERRSLKVAYFNKSRLAIANHELLFSVIYNFCVNALHYSDLEATSEITVRDCHDKIQVNVRDYGPALPTKIWRELQHGELSRPAPIAMRPSSSGLGLYIASQFAHHMHADFGAIRHRDGTSFYVSLPISHQATLPF